MKIVCISILCCVFLSYGGFCQSVRSAIAGGDFFGAWFVPGSSRAWIVDNIPERARLWDYESNQEVLSVRLKANLKDVNVLNSGSLAYIAHHDKNEYIILNQDGSQAAKKFKQNAPSYYIHPDGMFFFGSTLEGFVTYTIKGKKIINSKPNEGITGYSSEFMDTAVPECFFRAAKEFIQAIIIDAEGRLKSPRAFDKNPLLFNADKDEFLYVSPTEFRHYSVPELELKNSVKRKRTFALKSGVYDSERKYLYYSEGSHIHTYHLETDQLLSSADLGIEDLLFKDWDGKNAIGFSDSNNKFFVISLN